MIVHLQNKIVHVENMTVHVENKAVPKQNISAGLENKNARVRNIKNKIKNEKTVKDLWKKRQHLKEKIFDDMKTSLSKKRNKIKEMSDSQNLQKSKHPIV